MAVFIVYMFEGTRIGGQIDVVTISFDNTYNTFVSSAQNLSTGEFVIPPTTYQSMDPNYDGDFITSFCGQGGSEFEGDQFIINGYSEYPFAVSEINPDAAECGEPGPSCDLTLLVSRTDETAVAAGDGTITAVSTSSYADIEYSLDGGAWQSSGEFTGLTPKTYQVRSRDANGCLETKYITVLPYLNFLISSPERIHSTGHVSRWNAAFNPTLFRFRRVDYIGSVEEGEAPGLMNVTLDALLNDAEINSALNQPVTVQSTDGSGYNVYQPAMSHSVVSGNSVLAFMSPFISGDTSVFVGIIASKPNYKVELNIITQGKITKGYWSPDAAGIIRADVSAYLKNLVSPSVKSVPYTISYREIWDGNEGDIYENPNTFYATYSAMQLGEHGGGNMVDYVAFANADPVAKWLTKFIEPVYSPGLPFDLSFIRDKETEGLTLSLEITSLDINKDPIGVPESVAIGTGAAAILSPVISPAPVLNAKFLSAKIVNSATSEAITEAKVIATEEVCDNDPYIYIKWINQLGGWDYYRFGYTQNVSVQTSTQQAVKLNVLDWENSTTIWQAIKKNANKRVQFGASGIKDISGLEWLPVSVEVMLLVAPGVWHTVELSPGSFSLGSTRDKTFNVQFSINLPEYNIQTQ